MKIAVLGAGVMGRLVERAAEEAGHKVVGVVEPLDGQTLEMLFETPDAVIDFSHPDNTDALCGFCGARGLPAVIGCTGHDDAQKQRIAKLAERCGVVMSANFSCGINALLGLVFQAAKMLGGGFDAELVETHHRRKADAPSGTALMLIEALKKGLACGERELVFDRRNRGKRTESEIGISTVRGGDVCGKHEIIFLGDGETISLTHTASDRSVFARGALKAAQWLCVSGKKGLFSMTDVIKGDCYAGRYDVE